jgi:hypothetical protein
VCCWFYWFLMKKNCLIESGPPCMFTHNTHLPSILTVANTTPLVIGALIFPSSAGIYSPRYFTKTPLPSQALSCSYFSFLSLTALHWTENWPTPTRWLISELRWLIENLSALGWIHELLLCFALTDLSAALKWDDIFRRRFYPFEVTFNSSVTVYKLPMITILPLPSSLTYNYFRKRLYILGFLTAVLLTGLKTVKSV